MKLKNLVVSMMSIALGIGSAAALAAGDYFPPERLHCKVDNSFNLTCSDFNRRYLIEYTRTADFPPGKDIILTFDHGTAYADQKEWSVFFTYADTKGKNVRLATVDTSIHPDFQNGAWKKNFDHFRCTAGYMSCPITSLPPIK